MSVHLRLKCLLRSALQLNRLIPVITPVISKHNLTNLLAPKTKQMSKIMAGVGVFKREQSNSVENADVKAERVTNPSIYRCSISNPVNISCLKCEYTCFI